jgi:branched-subunit amino acid transport protein
MEIREPVMWAILGAALVTFIPRVLPLVVLSRIQLPNWALRFLSHIPVAVMAALLAQELLTAKDQLIPIWHNVNLLAFVPTLLIAILTRSLLGTVIGGILSMMLVRLIV